MKTLKSYLTLGLISISMAGQAQVNIPALSYSQDFNALGSANAPWTDNSTLQGWYAAVSNATSGTVGPYTTAYTVGTGGGTSSSTLYALGDTGDTERALGGAASSSSLGVLGLRLLNTSGSTFNTLNIKFDFEQWSDRGTASVDLSYHLFAAGGGNLSTLTGWTFLGSLSSPLPQGPGPTYSNGLGNTTGLLAGNAYDIGSLGWQNGDELWFKWTLTKLAGNNCTHGIDNVSLSVPEPASLTLLGIGLVLVVNRLRRRL
jgi:hypothetical protein